ncbi:class I SAM-dependent methyltransferase [bacterium]|nr:class I SAM-dependent methyltransferase [bacterium]
MAEKHFFEQRAFTESYLVPYFDRHIPEWRSFRVLEIGCAESGFLDVIGRLDVRASGMELMEERVALALTFNPELNVQAGDITDPEITACFPGPYDLIVMRDVIEHIPDREAAFRNIRTMLRPGGYLYISFPPLFSAFAGHHQNGRSPLKYFPWLHLLPGRILRFMGRVLDEYPHIIDQAILHRQSGLTIRRFLLHIRQIRFKPVVCEYFLSRPVYRERFGWPVIRFPGAPFVREFLAAGCESLLRKSGP